jgi:hypothetical protein
MCETVNPIRSTNFDKDNLELYYSTLDALFKKYTEYYNYNEIFEKLEMYAEEGDPIKFELALEMIEDVFL